MPHDADEHRHAEVLERTRVAVAAELDPEVVDADLLAVALGPEQVRAALVHRDDDVVGQLGHDPLALAPDARAVRPGGSLVAIVEELHPRRAAAIREALPCRGRPRAARRISGSGRWARVTGHAPVAAREAAKLGGVRHARDYSSGRCPGPPRPGKLPTAPTTVRPRNGGSLGARSRPADRPIPARVVGGLPLALRLALDAQAAGARGVVVSDAALRAVVPERSANAAVRVPIPLSSSRRTARRGARACELSRASRAVQSAGGARSGDVDLARAAPAIETPYAFAPIDVVDRRSASPGASARCFVRSESRRTAGRRAT